MKKYNNFELLLLSAAEECIEEEATEFLSQDTAEIDGKLKKKKQVETLLKKEYRPYSKKHRYRTLLAIAALLIVALLSTACFSFTNIGQKAYKAVVGFFDKYISIDFEEKEPHETIPEDTETVCETDPLLPSSPPSSIERKAYASYLPSTYTCTIDGKSATYYMLSYYDLENNWVFTIMQYTFGAYSHYSDYEGQATEYLNIRGNRAILIKDQTQPNYYSLIWRDSCYEYSIYGNFSDISTLKKIAEGIALE